MRVIIADHAGFCFGVNRAMNMTTRSLDENNKEKHYSLGPLIHNNQVVKKLESKGLEVNENYNEYKENSNVIIRSHGVKKTIISELKNMGYNVIDTTCPYVKSIYKKVEEFYKKGYNIIIVGNSEHPEIIGINSWCDNKAIILKDSSDAEKVQNMSNACVVCQTTYRKEEFNKIISILECKIDKLKVYNTICDATFKRQDSAYKLAKKVDAMIVIGGYHSSNTNKLVEISKKACNNVYHIETIDDISLNEVSKFNTIGITAGASTPDWIIKEAVEVMDNLNKNNEEMMEAIEKSFTQISRGDILEGEVIFVTDEEVMVNINYTSDGIITKDELSNDPDIKPSDICKEGDKIQVYVVRNDDGEGNVVLSAKRVKDMKNWEIVEEKYENEELLDVKVVRVVKGGLIVLVEGINGFIPASHVSARYITDLKQFVGEEFKVSILDFDKQKRRLVLSRKEVEQKELEDVRKKLWENLEKDSIIEGTVQRLTNFGAFVDLGGVDGLIHISDLSWNRIKHPSDIVEPGEKVKVKVLDFDEEKNRISLGLKQTKEKPWELFKKSAEVGEVVEGTVVNLLDFGAFIRLEEGVDGLLHVSEISRDHVNKPADVLTVGQKVRVKIIDIDYDEEKISLSKKEADAPIEDIESEDKADKDSEEVNTEEAQE